MWVGMIQQQSIMLMSKNVDTIWSNKLWFWEECCNVTILWCFNQMKNFVCNSNSEWWPIWLFNVSFDFVTSFMDEPLLSQQVTPELPQPRLLKTWNDPERSGTIRDGCGAWNENFRKNFYYHKNLCFSSNWLKLFFRIDCCYFKRKKI